MRKYLLIAFFTFIFIGFSNSHIYAQKVQQTNILFVFDASQSMYARWGNETRMQVATRLLREAVDSLRKAENTNLALRVFGHQNFVISKDKRNCEDTKLEIPFSANNHDEIISRLRTIQPRGTTLIAYSLEKAANDFPSCSDCRNIIILITDGIEECGGDPCAVSMALQKKGVALKPFIIGMGLEPDLIDTFDCVGNFYDAQDATTFREVLQIVISQAMNTTSAQVNLLDNLHKPTETNVPMTFYDSHSGEVRYNFIHTLDSRGNPDTIPIDPLGTYDLVVHTVPPVKKDKVKITAGKHNVIAVDAPQGSLELKMNGFNEYKDLKAIVREKGKQETLVVQDFDKIQNYIIGHYDLEILTLPRTYIKGVNIAQDHNTKVEIPQAGVASINTSARGYGSVFKKEADRLVWIYDLPLTNNRINLTLQPGSYHIVFRPQNARLSIYTKEESFKITSGKSTHVNL